MNSSKDQENADLEELLGQLPARRAPGGFCREVLAEARETPREKGPVLERWAELWQRDWRLPVLVLIPATAVLMLLAVAVFRPATEDAGRAVVVETQMQPEPVVAETPTQLTPEPKPEAVEAPVQIAELSEREFEIVLVLDSLMESEEAQIWSEDSEMYF